MDCFAKILAKACLSEVMNHQHREWLKPDPTPPQKMRPVINLQFSVGYQVELASFGSSCKTLLSRTLRASPMANDVPHSPARVYDCVHLDEVNTYRFD